MIAESLTPEQVAHHYNELDYFYRTIWGEHVHHGYWKRWRDTPEIATRHLIDLAAARAHLTPHADICDVGCGYGATARLLVDLHDVNVTGLTISQSQLAYAQNATSGSNPSYRLHNWLENDFESESFDVVIAIESLLHMNDRTRAVAECYRVLKPGGRFVMLDWLSGASPHRWVRRVLLNAISRDMRVRLLSMSDHVELLTSVGFSVTSEDLSARVAWTWPWAMARAIPLFFTDADTRRYLRDASNTERASAIAMLTLTAGYATGALRYGILTGTKPRRAR